MTVLHQLLARAAVRLVLRWSLIRARSAQLISTQSWQALTSHLHRVPIARLRQKPLLEDLGLRLYTEHHTILLRRRRSLTDRIGKAPCAIRPCYVRHPLTNPIAVVPFSRTLRRSMTGEHLSSLLTRMVHPSQNVQGLLARHLECLRHNRRSDNLLALSHPAVDPLLLRR
jgi:hypothetical protein